MESAVWISITFVCLFNIGGALSNKAFLALREEPKDTVFNTDSNREFATFYCYADGYPKPDITWLANDQIVTENDLYNVTEEGTLRILDPPRRLNGSIYRCIASNSFGAVMSKAAILEIAYVERFSGGLSDVQINARLGKCITCNPPEAYPGIKAIWSKDTINTVNPNERIREMTDGQLCFAHSETGDTGNYRCSVSNRYDEGGAATYTSSSNFKFEVLPVGATAPSQSLTPAPGMQTSVTVRQGQEAVLECFFLGRPTPTLAWSREGNDLPSNSTLSRDNQELRIPNAQPEDGGEYQCTGTSMEDSAIVNRRLTVLAPPLLVSGLKDEEVDPGTTVTLQCMADSDDVEFSWYHNTRLINSSMQRPRISDDNTLTIDDFMVEDSGIYQCAARNEHGITLSTAQLFVKGQDPTTGNPIDPEQNQPNSELQGNAGNGAGYTLVHGFSTVVMVSAALFEVILIFVL